jgi:hypothetical protein
LDQKRQFISLEVSEGEGQITPDTAEAGRGHKPPLAAWDLLSARRRLLWRNEPAAIGLIDERLAALEPGQGCSVLLKSVREDAFQGQGIVGGRAPLTSITPCAGGRHGAVR